MSWGGGRVGLGMGVNDSCMLSVHTSHCLEKWEKREESF